MRYSTVSAGAIIPNSWREISEDALRLELTICADRRTPFTPILVCAASSIELAVPLRVANTTFHAGFERATTVRHDAGGAVTLIAIGVGGAIRKVTLCPYKRKQERRLQEDGEDMKARRHLRPTRAQDEKFRKEETGSIRERNAQNSRTFSGLVLKSAWERSPILHFEAGREVDALETYLSVRSLHIVRKLGTHDSVAASSSMHVGHCRLAAVLDMGLLMKATD